MNLHQFSAIIPIGCGLILLYLAVRDNCFAKALRPTLVLLAVSGIIYGLLVVGLDSLEFRHFLGPRISLWLKDFKFFIAGIGTGAAVASIFYGHWKVAWQSARRTTKHDHPVQ